MERAGMPYKPNNSAMKSSTVLAFRNAAVDRASFSARAFAQVMAASKGSGTSMEGPGLGLQPSMR